MAFLSAVRAGARFDRLLSLLADFGRRLAEFRQKPPPSDIEALLQSLEPPRVPLAARLLDRWFPPREFLMRSPGHDQGGETSVLHLSQRLQLGAASLAMAGLAGFLIVSATAAWNRHDAERLEQQMADLRGTAVDAQTQLGRLQRELAHFITERERTSRTLAGTLSDIDLAGNNRARLLDERDRALAERNVALDANRLLLATLDNQTRTAIAQIENIIAATGLDLARFAPRTAPDDRGLPRGGPFVPWTRAADPWRPEGEPQSASERQFDSVASGIARLHALGGFLAHLPLASPLAQIDVAAGFGGFGYRLDPFNREASMHEGVDLADIPGAPVFAAAAGSVIFAGWHGEYGNMVEIDHGQGITTRYAHLWKIAVKPGQAMAPRQPLGTVGSTGRSTGAHLHYEDRVDGKARDPLTFFKAARSVR